MTEVDGEVEDVTTPVPEEGGGLVDKLVMVQGEEMESGSADKHVNEPLRELVSGPIEELVAEPVDQTIERLAALGRLEYDLVRKAEAEKLGIRVTTLDEEVERRRQPAAEDVIEGQGQAINFPEIEAWSSVVEGGKLLDELDAAYKRYVVLGRYSRLTISLWCIFAHCYRAFDHSPRLGLQSPQPRCGKTTVVKITAHLVPRALRADSVSPSALFRMIELHSPTMLIDEADTFAKDNDELRGIVNSGHERLGGSVIRNVGDTHEPRAFGTWGVMLLAGIGGLAQTIEDRSIIVQLKRKLRDEKVERLRSNHCDHLKDLARRIVRWVNDHESILSGADPQMPDELGDRAADNWRPLLAIADAVGEPWSSRARAAAVRISGDGDSSNQSVSIRLLADIRKIYGATTEVEIPSLELVGKLQGFEDSPWSDWYRGKPISAKRVAEFLSTFSIHPRKLKKGKRLNGYHRDQFVDAFSRYLDS